MRSLAPAAHWPCARRLTRQLQAEHEACQRLQGENGILKRKFVDQQQAVDEAEAGQKAAQAEAAQLAKVRHQAQGRGLPSGAGASSAFP